jgi:hypothetical protein
VQFIAKIFVDMKAFTAQVTKWLIFVDRIALHRLDLISEHSSQSSLAARAPKPIWETAKT